MIQSRRSFIRGAVATLFAAPAIVKISSIMPVKALPAELSEAFVYQYTWNYFALGYAITRKAIDENLYKNHFSSLTPLDEGLFTL